MYIPANVNMYNFAYHFLCSIRAVDDIENPFIQFYRTVDCGEHRLYREQSYFGQKQIDAFKLTDLACVSVGLL